MEVAVTKNYIKELKLLPKNIIIAADNVIVKLKDAKSLQESGAWLLKKAGL